MATVSSEGIGEHLANIIRASAAGETYDVDRMVQMFTLTEATDALRIITDVQVKIDGYEAELSGR